MARSRRDREIDLAAEGGGAKGLGHAGAYAELLDQGYTVKSWAGTSAGAYFCLMGAIGLTPNEMMQAMMERRGGQPLFQHFFETGRPRGLTKLWRLRRHGGMFEANRMELWLKEKLEERDFSPAVTFREFADRTGVELTVVGFDWDDGRELDLNAITAPDLPIYCAVRLSGNIPFWWRPFIWRKELHGRYRDRNLDGHEIVDGGVHNNLPLDLYLGSRKWKTLRRRTVPRPAIALVLDESRAAPGFRDASRQGKGDWLCRQRVRNEDTLLSAIKGAARIFAPVTTRLVKLQMGMMNAHNLRVEENWPDCICRIGVQQFGVLEALTAERAQLLFESGRHAMRTFLRKNASKLKSVPKRYGHPAKP